MNVSEINRILHRCLDIRFCELFGHDFNGGAISTQIWYENMRDHKSPSSFFIIHDESSNDKKT